MTEKVAAISLAKLLELSWAADERVMIRPWRGNGYTEVRLTKSTKDSSHRVSTHFAFAELKGLRSDPVPPRVEDMNARLYDAVLEAEAEEKND